MAKKTAVKKQKEPNPLEELVVSAEDILECQKFYELFEIPQDPTFEAMCFKLKKGGIFTLEDQIVLRKIIAADVSKATHRVFADTLFKSIRLDVAKEYCKQVAWELKQAVFG